VGFAWAFLSAGARNVIASMWDVSDQSTAAFMQSLYRHLSGNEMPGDALRAVKLEFVHKANGRNKPYYWAPFQTYVR
jgi:CHAT domain-containing protein